MNKERKLIFIFIVFCILFGGLDKYFPFITSIAHEMKLYPAYEFKMQDQYGKEHRLSDYKGKIVILSYWVTWCPDCQYEMPKVQEIYKEYGENKKDVIILTVTNPVTEFYPKNRDISIDELKSFVKKESYDFPVLFDVASSFKMDYEVTNFPSTYVVTKEGLLRGVVRGRLSKDQLRTLIETTN